MIAELARVTRPGGYLHLIPEDYGMLHFQRGPLYPGDFWHTAEPAFSAATNTDLLIGRNAFGILAAMNLEEIAVDYVIVDTLRVPRETFAAIFEAWRDGYAESIGEITPISRESAVAYFNQMASIFGNCAPLTPGLVGAQHAAPGADAWLAMPIHHMHERALGGRSFSSDNSRRR